MKPYFILSTFLTGATALGLAVPTAGVFSKSSPHGSLPLDKIRKSNIAPERYAVPKMKTETDDATAGSLCFRGLVVNGDTPYIGEFTVTEGDLKVSRIYTDEDMIASGGALYADGLFYVQTVEQPYIGSIETLQTVYDATDWSIIDRREGLLISSSALSMTYDPVTCSAYGYFHNDDDGGESKWYGYGSMNLATGEVRMYNSVDQDEGFVCLAYSPDGNLYGVNYSGQYCRISREKGEITVLGHTDLTPQYVQSAVIDPSTGIFYWAAMTDRGESALYEVDPVTYIARKIADFPDNQEFVGLYIASQTASASKIAAVNDAVAKFDKDNLYGEIVFNMPESTVGGMPLTGTLTGHVAVDGCHYEATAEPGEECRVPVSVSADGLYIFTVWVSDESAEGEKITVQKWVGADTPGPVTGLTLSGEGQTLTLTWEAPSEIGQHEGYVNPAEVTYVINRDGVSMSTIYDYTQCVLEQTFAPDVTAYISYSVRPVYKEKVGPSTVSDKVRIGEDVRTVPVELNPSAIQDFIVIDRNDDGETWVPGWGYASCQSVSEGSDDWLLTPVLSLKGGKMYEVTYEVSAKMGTLYPQTLELRLGIGSTADDMDTLIDEKTLTGMSLVQFETVSSVFTAPTDGNYRLGFRSTGANMGVAGLGTISISEAGESKGPSAPSGCRVEAAPGGELKATVYFTAPDTDSAGEPLESIGLINVYCGERLVGYVENPTPGSEYSVTDMEAEQGQNRYEIEAIGAEGATGPRASVTGWIGTDIPSLPENIRISEDNGDLLISWILPEYGVHGGFVDSEEVVYTFMDPSFGTVFGQITGTTSARLPLGDLKSQTTVMMAIGVSNSGGINTQVALSPEIVVGPSRTLPFFETFAGGRSRYGWHLFGDSGDDVVGWMPTEELGPDGEPGISSYWGSIEEIDDQTLVSQRISLKGTSSPALRFFLLGRSAKDTEGKFIVSVSEQLHGEYTTVYERTFEGAGTAGIWEKIEIPLTSYTDKDLFFAFSCMPGRGDMVVGIDDISIREAVDYDLSLESITLDRDEVRIGEQPAVVRVRVQNHGTKDIPAESYKVLFYAGDRQFAVVDGLAVEASFGQNIYEAEYAPVFDDTDPAVISARIDSDMDMNQANDISDSAEIYVVRPIAPAVSDLSGSVEAEGAVLTWSQPDQSGLPIRTVTDDFESYRDFDINRAGDWTIVDEDSLPGTHTSYYFPGSAGPMGWVVQNPGQIPNESGTYADIMPAYSGERYMAAYNPQGGDNSDWLITPELSGRAQTISFMARAESAKVGREMFEVYVSETGNDIADMVRLDDCDWRTSLNGWEKYSFEVPDGTRYFAVRCVSHSRRAMHIDDFTYESASTPLTVHLIGYNIYRNGVKLNTEPVTATSFTDTAIPSETDCIYTVRAVYDCGETIQSNPVVLTAVGVETIRTDIDPISETVYDLQGRRVYHLTEGEYYVSSGRVFIYRVN